MRFMKKKLKDVVSVLCAGSVIAGLLAANTLNAATDQTNVQVSVTNKPTVDICLSSKDTGVDLSSFEQDVRNRLEQLGVDTSNIVFRTAETVEDVVDKTNASEIINNYTTFPFNTNSYWYFDEEKQAITSDVNESYETGFFDDKYKDLRNIEISSDIYVNERTQPVGLFLKLTPQENNPDRYDGYFLWHSSSDYTGFWSDMNNFIVLFKVKGIMFDAEKRSVYSSFKNGEFYTAMPLALVYYNDAWRLGWLYQNDDIPNYGGVPRRDRIKGWCSWRKCKRQRNVIRSTWILF